MSKRTLYSHCPYKDCSYHSGAPVGWYRKRGYYRPRSNKYQPIPRYECMKCHRRFSAQSFRPVTFRQKKAYLNEQFRSLFTKGMSIAGAARHLHTTWRTAANKHDIAGRESKKAVQAEAQVRQYDTIQFDEFETYEHTRMKPLSCPLAVAVDSQDASRSGFILGFDIAEMPCARRNGKIAKAIYGARKDEREEKIAALFKRLSESLPREDIRIVTDTKPHYKPLVRAAFPKATYKGYKSQRLTIARRMGQIVESEKFRFDEYEQMPEAVKAPHGYWVQRMGAKCKVRPRNPLFWIDHAIQKVRDRTSRLRKHTWGPTRKRERLALALWMIVADINGVKVNWRNAT